MKRIGDLTDDEIVAAIERNGLRGVCDSRIDVALGISRDDPKSSYAPQTIDCDYAIEQRLAKLVAMGKLRVDGHWDASGNCRRHFLSPDEWGARLEGKHRGEIAAMLRGR